jgi:hypothetical protein
VAHLKQLQEKYGKRGLNIIALSGESRVNVERYMWLENPDMTWPVAIKARNPYGVSGIPHAYLIGHDGVVVWEGNPYALKEEVVEKAVRAIPSWGKKGTSRVKAAGKHIDKGDYGKAWKAAKTLLSKEGISDEDRAGAEAIVAHLEKVAERRLTWVQALIDDGDAGTAEKLLEEMTGTWARTEWADKAAARQKEMTRDDRAKALLAASESVSKILKRLKGKVNDKQRMAAHKSLQKLQAKVEGDAAEWIGRFVEILAAKWESKRT